MPGQWTLNPNVQNLWEIAVPPVQPQLSPAEQQEFDDWLEEINFQQEINNNMAKPDSLKASRSVSPRSDSLLVPAVTLRELTRQIRQEMEELANVADQISMLAEVASEIGTQVLEHISTLQMVATQPETEKVKKPPLGPGLLVQAQAAGLVAPGQVGPIVGAALGQAAPQPFVQGQE